MLLSEENIQLIEKYLDETISEDERKVLESLILKDAAFKHEVILQRSVLEGIIESNKQKLREELKGHLQKTNSSNRYLGYPIKTNWPYLSVAAAISFIVAVLLYVLLFSRQSSSDELFVAYYKPYPGLTSTRSVSDTLNDVALSSFGYYSAGNYESAAVGLKQVIKEDTSLFDADALKLMLGNCYLNLNRPDDALKIFEEIERSGGPIARQHSQWYAALTMIRYGQENQALLVLEEIKNSGLLYAKRAGELTQRIEKD